MKIYDCFTFFNELDLLEIRLNELNDAVDYFVLVEATKTQTGLPKSLYFENNKKMFEKFNKKIIHVIVDDMPDIKRGAWVLENYQRNQIMRGLTKCKDDDIIFISDLDEIPNKNDFPEIIKRLTSKRNLAEKVNRLINVKLIYFFNLFNTSKLTLKNKIIRKINRTIEKIFPNKNIVELKQEWYFYYLNGDSNHAAVTTRACKFITLKNDLQSKPHNIRYIFSGNIINSGWHFSYLGGWTRINDKLKSLSDYENIDKKKEKEKIIKKIKENKVLILNSERKIKFVKIDNTFPKYIQENKNKLNMHICDKYE